jgi:CheY-like chemotaxis protein
LEADRRSTGDMQRLDPVAQLRALPAVARPPLVLVVDDEPLVRHLLVRKLQHHGFTVREASDGEEALANVHQAPPDIVLTDLHMPNCDGERLCQLLKAGSATSAIPVVLMTAGTIDEDLMRVVGFDDVVYKPLPQDLPHLLRALLANQSPEAERADAAAGPTQPRHAWAAGRSARR